MRAVVQRVAEARVTSGDELLGEIGRGLVVLLGVRQTDQESDADYLAQKTLGLRIFEDDAGKMNRSVIDVSGAVLVVSQFTLLGDCRHGRRPSFIDAAPLDLANRLYEHYVATIRAQAPVATGRFQAMMQVALVNDGPVTILLDSEKLF